MTQTKLNEVLEKHKLWLAGEEKGERANLERADLRGANLWGANLQRANLRGADLQEADLWGANLRGADLRGANLRGANLRGADLQEADLWGANLQEADLQRAYLWGADLQEADLWGANLEGANLDYSALPLCCGSLHAKYDDKQVIQFLYHTLSAAQSEHVSEEIKKVLLSPEIVEIANRFHRIDECGKIKSYEEEN